MGSEVDKKTVVCDQDLAADFSLFLGLFRGDEMPTMDRLLTAPAPSSPFASSPPLRATLNLGTPKRGSGRIPSATKQAMATSDTNAMSDQTNLRVMTRRECG